MSLRIAPPLHEKLEKEWDGELFNKKGLATALGWTSQWTFKSQGSRAGFPDRSVFRERILFAELKREPPLGKQGQPLKLQHPLSREQIEWLDRIVKAAGEAYVWIPSDWDEIGVILGHPWRLEGTTLSSSSRAAWTPGSMWIRGVGRADGRDI